MERGGRLSRRACCLGSRWALILVCAGTVFRTSLAASGVQRGFVSANLIRMLFATSFVAR